MKVDCLFEFELFVWKKWVREVVEKKERVGEEFVIDVNDGLAGIVWALTGKK